MDFMREVSHHLLGVAVGMTSRHLTGADRRKFLENRYHMFSITLEGQQYYKETYNCEDCDEDCHICQILGTMSQEFQLLAFVNKSPRTVAYAIREVRQGSAYPIGLSDVDLEPPAVERAFANGWLRWGPCTLIPQEQYDREYPGGRQS